MSDARILIVGAGPAGLSAAVELARAGHGILLVDQASAIGGAIHRQPLPGRASIARRAERRRWSALDRDLEAAGSAIEIRLRTRFGGIDPAGELLLAGVSPTLMRPRAVIIATGAREAVQPRPGWTLPGVMTAGAIQTYLKTQAAAPPGRIVLAGSGPLLVAVGAQLCALGRPPVAIVEAGRPFAHPLAAATLPRSYLAEAAAYLVRLRSARVPVLSGGHVSRITRDGDALLVDVEGRRGAHRLACDLVGLHDGIRANDTGLTDRAPIPVLRLGDCREALGARAALADGRDGGRRLAALLAGDPEPAASAQIIRERRAQAQLAKLYAHDGHGRLSSLPGDTVICRCEMRTIDDLRALGPAPTDRALRLDGRFSMGPCQGRFCAEWVQRLAGRSPGAARIGAARFPVAPISVAELISADLAKEGDTP